MDLLKTSASYGIIGALISFFFFIACYVLNVAPYGTWSWITAFVPLVLIILGSLKVRKELGGYITYWSALQAAIVITFLYASAFNMMAFLFSILVDTEGVILNSQQQLALEGMEAAKAYMTEEMYDMAIESIEKMTIGSIAWGDFLNKMLGWGIVSLIVAAFIRKKDESFGGQFKDSTAD